MDNNSLTNGRLGVHLVTFANVAGSESVTFTVHGLALALLTDLRMDAHVLPRAEHQTGEGWWIGAVALVVNHQVLQLGDHFLDLRNSTRAVDELAHRFRMLHHVGNDQGEQRGRLARSRGHLQQAVALGVQATLKFQHVGILFRVDVLVRKVHQQAVHAEPVDWVVKGVLSFIPFCHLLHYSPIPG